MTWYNEHILDVAAYQTLQIQFTQTAKPQTYTRTCLGLQYVDLRSHIVSLLLQCLRWRFNGRQCGQSGLTVGVFLIML